MTVVIKNSRIDVNSWYQKVTLTFTNESNRPVDLNQAAISFTASGHPDPWGNTGGTLKGDRSLTLRDTAQGTLEFNEIIINNSSELLLQAGESGTLYFSLAATQVPVKLSTFTLTLAASDSADEVDQNLKNRRMTPLMRLNQNLMNRRMTPLMKLSQKLKYPRMILLMKLNLKRPPMRRLPAQD